jgi:hypothetical protein
MRFFSNSSWMGGARCVMLLRVEGIHHQTLCAEVPLLIVAVEPAWFV